MGKRLFIGSIKNGSLKGLWNPFWSEKTPTEETHGDRYTIAEGPFKTKQDAVDRINCAWYGRGFYGKVD